MVQMTLFQSVVAATALGGVAGLVLTTVAWRRRQVPASRPLALLSLVGSLWAFLHLAVILSPSASTALTLNRTYSIVAVYVPLFWTMFVVVYTGRREWLDSSRLVLLCLPFGLYTVGMLTAPFHDLTGTTVTFVTANGIRAPVVENGAMWVFGTVVSYAYMLGGYALLGRFYLRSRNVYQKQTGAIIVGSAIPFAGHGSQLLLGNIHPAVDFTPVLFTAYAAVIGVALYRYDFLQVSPVVGDILVDELPDPMVVLDDSGKILDYNPALEAVATTDDPTGTLVDEVIPKLSEHLDPPETFSVSSDGMTIFDPQVTAIDDQHGNPHGRLVVLRDVTAQQRRLEQLEALQSATQRFIGARTEAEVADIALSFATDVLDQPLGVVDIYDEESDELVPLSVTDDLDETVSKATLRVERDSGQTWEVYESGELAVLDDDHPIVRFDDVPAESGLLLPLGDHGVMGIGVDDEEAYTEAEKQFARILARTTETALTRIEHEQRLRENNRALERRNDQIAFFNGVLRHNIRNGMLVIDGHARHLRAELDDGHEKLDVISEWSDELAELTEKVRAIKNTLTASEQERLDAVDLSAQLESIVPPIVEEYDGEYDLDVHDGITVHANDLVSDIIESLVRNAFEHNDADNPRVEIRTQLAGDWVQVHVEDNGPGVSDEMKERVFEKDVATSQTAAGFGLYFVAVMMDLYGGKVWLEDGAPSGADAILEFRLAEDTVVLKA